MNREEIDGQWEIVALFSFGSKDFNSCQYHFVAQCSPRSQWSPYIKDEMEQGMGSIPDVA